MHGTILPLRVSFLFMQQGVAQPHEPGKYLGSSMNRLLLYLGIYCSMAIDAVAPLSGVWGIRGFAFPLQIPPRHEAAPSSSSPRLYVGSCADFCAS